MPIAKEIVPKIVETTGNAIGPGMGTVAKVGVGDLLNDVDSLLHKGHNKQSQGLLQGVTQGIGQGLRQSLAVLREPPSYGHSTFTMKDPGDNFVPHAKGFIGKRK